MGRKKNEETIEEEEYTFEPMPTDKLKKYAKNISAYQADMDKARGEVGQQYKKFEEDGGNKKAFKLALKVREMEPVSGQEFLRAFYQYMQDLGVFDQLDMFEEVPVPNFESGAAGGEQAAALH